MRRILTSLVFAIAAANAWATQLPWRAYTTADGLARDTVNCIVRDSRGFLWLCTAEASRALTDIHS
jgi:hypothetical protein